MTRTALGSDTPLLGAMASVTHPERTTDMMESASSHTGAIPKIFLGMIQNQKDKIARSQ